MMAYCITCLCHQRISNLSNSATGLYELELSDDVLVLVQKNLFVLKDFLDKNPHLFHSAPGDHTGARGASASEQEAWKAEQSSVSQLSI